VTLSEPATFVTDMLLAAVSGAFASHLLTRRASARQMSVTCWGGAFAAVALGALTGGLWHGAAPALSPAAADTLWRVSLQAIGLGSFLMVAGSARALLARTARRWVSTAATLQWIAYTMFMAWHDDFRFVVFDVVPSLLFLAAMHGAAALRHRSSGSIPLATGALASLVAAGIQGARLAPAPWFNHNDLFHVVQLGANALLFMGARRLVDAVP
jgi:hypothetical protein